MTSSAQINSSPAVGHGVDLLDTQVGTAYTKSHQGPTIYLGVVPPSLGNEWQPGTHLPSASSFLHVHTFGLPTPRLTPLLRAAGIQTYLFNRTFASRASIFLKRIVACLPGLE